jgi:uncharacterized repeat protein (TIGR01451 family)
MFSTLIFLSLMMGLLSPVGALATAPEAENGSELMLLSDGSVDCRAYDNYMFAEPREVAEQCSNFDLTPTNYEGTLAPTDMGFAHDIGYISDNVVEFVLNDFPGQTVLSTSAAAIFGYDYDAAGTTLYALNYDTNEFGTFDPSTGTFTAIGPSAPGPGENWTGLTIDPSTDTFYASGSACGSYSNLYTLDPATGTPTVVGDITGATCVIDIAMNPSGEMYAHDIVTDSMYQVDPSTGAGTLLGPTGYPANYAQGMDFDNDDGTLYIFLYQGGGANVYGTVDLVTGAVTPLSIDNPLGEFEGAIPNPGVVTKGTLNGTVTEAGTGNPIEGAMVVAENITDTYGFSTDVTGFYSDTINVGTYTVTASMYGYVPNEVAGIEVFLDTITTQDFVLDPATFYTVDGYVTDVNTGWPLYASLDIDGYPGDPIWTDPVTGYYSVSLAEGVDYTFNVDAWVGGYLPDSRAVGPLTGDVQEDFALDVDQGTCTAPGYYYDTSSAYFEDFESGYTDWTMSGLWNAEAEGDACGSLVSPFPSPTNASYYGQDGICTFDTGAANSGSLTMNTDFSLTGTGIMRFSSFEETECGGDCSYDNRYVEISDDSGVSWTTLGEGNTEGTWYQREFDLAAYAGEDVRVRFRLDDVLIGALDCVPAPGGLVVGNVYDDNTMDGLVGAEVVNDDGFLFVTEATPDDAAVDDGFYTLFASASQYFTATMTGGYAPDTEMVTVVAGDAVDQDFYLPAGWLVADPDSMHVTLDWGDGVTETLDLSNNGGEDVDFEIVEVDQGWMPALLVSIPASDGNFPRGDAAPSSGAAPLAALAGGVPLAQPLATLGTLAYATDAVNGFHTQFDLDVPDVLPNLGPFVPADFPGAGEFVNGYVYVADSSNNLYQLDPATGAVLSTIPITAPPGGETYSGFAIDPTTGVLYGSSTSIVSSSLFEVDVTTGVSTLIGPITNSACNIALAIDGAGDMWAYDICIDSFMSIDKATGAGTVIGSIGFDANFGQGMGWDPATGQVYLAAFNSGTFQAELRIADTSTGNTAFVGVLGSTTPGGLTQLPYLGVPVGVGGPDVPWVSEDPISGTVTAMGNVLIDVGFDSSVVSQPGDYFADLEFVNDTPYGELVVPLTMTVNPASDMGKVHGYVLDNCLGDPLEDVYVSIPGGIPIDETYTDADGYYAAWLVEGTYDFVFTLEDYLTFTETVDVVAGETFVLDVGLVPDRPCIEVYPDMFDVWLITGTLVYTDPMGMDIINNGGQDLDFDLVEIDGGFAPPLALEPMAPNLVVIGDLGFSTSPAGVVESGDPYVLPSVPPEAILITHSVDQSIISLNSVSCNAGGLHTDNGYLRKFTLTDFGITGDFNVTNVEIGIETATGAGGTQPGTMNLYTWNPADAFIYANFTLIGTADTMVADQALTIIDVPVVGTAPAGSTLVVEFFTPNGQTAGNSLFVGSNNLGQTDFTYLAAADCGVPEPLDTGSIGFPDMHLVMNVVGEESGVAPDVPWFWEVPTNGTVPSLDMWNIDVAFTALEPDMITPMALGTYTATLEVNNNDPVAGTLLLPVSMHIVEEFIDPVASFVSDEPVCLGETMTFTNTSVENVPPTEYYLWDFGDGETMMVYTADPVTHDYLADGTFTVTLTAHQWQTGVEVIFEDTVEVKPLPVAGFSYTQEQLTIHFTNLSENTTTYLWDFGDGITSTLESPSHDYPASDFYTVTLWAFGDCGAAYYEEVVWPQASDVEISKMDMPDPVAPGGTLTYDLTVTNNGPDTAWSVMVVDTLPADTTFVSASAGCVEAAGVVTCDLGDMLTGATATVTIEVTAPADYGSITNMAEVFTNSFDADLTNNTISEDTMVGFFNFLPVVFGSD